MRKPRSDSKLDGLDLDQQRQLCEWLLTPGLSYETVKKLVFEQFNTSTNSSSLSTFYQSYCGAYLIQRRQAAVGIAQEVARDAKAIPGQWEPATIEALQVKAFEFASNPTVNPKDVKAIFSLVLKARDQDLKRKDVEIKMRRLEMLESSAKEAKEKLAQITTSKGGLTPETLKQIEEAAALL
jgi:hypothetical protein